MYALNPLLTSRHRVHVKRYVPDIRTPHNENFEEVKQLLHGERNRVRVLSLKTGDLQIFKGRCAATGTSR